jgi:hypothetical protein
MRFGFFALADASGSMASSLIVCSQSLRLPKDFGCGGGGDDGSSPPKKVENAISRRASRQARLPAGDTIDQLARRPSRANLRISCVV